jgi:hypothetical protein
MDWHDFVNASYEFGGALATCFNIRALWRDRVVRGVHWFPTAFFMSWGLWNLIYYSHLDQPWSTIGGGLLVLANAAWLALAWKLGAFKRNEEARFTNS